MTRPHAPAHRRVDLGRAEAMRLLGGVPLGRIVFTRQALPTVRPAGHVLDDGDLVVRTYEGAAPPSWPLRDDDTAVVADAVVAYEADAIDPDTHLGWSAVATGCPHPIAGPRELACARGLLHQPAARRGTDRAVRIRPEPITGGLLTDTEGAPEGRDRPWTYGPPSRDLAVDRAVGRAVVLPWTVRSVRPRSCGR
ncbi:pyridoxamine 5'-phosphate oxidase family protein [Streptomyces sp. NPDC052301]|uniref:pyridoxamine 5'-phosphate oxidase family protein n=1 Tax=Streptomyces sp. NPDC052301 TaxID=3365687 RepID=UPI0037D1EA52